MSEKAKTIKIKCKAHTLLPLEDLIDFQEGIKTIDAEAVEKLKASIVKYGFIAPIFIWPNEGRNNILDGHQRVVALCKLKEEGWKIPDIPVAMVEATNEKDAKEKLLHITSQYGVFQAAAVVNFIDNVKDIGTIRLIHGGEMIRFENDDMASEEVTEEIRPFRMTHVLLSFPPDKLTAIQDRISEIIKVPGVEYEQGSN